MTRKCILLGLAVVLMHFLFPNGSLAFKEQNLPQGLPPGLPNTIKGKFRIIEHDASKKNWIAYDVDRWKKQKEKLGGVELSGEEIRMYPPVIIYEYQGGTWSQQVVNEPTTNVYMSHLVTIIKANTPMKQPPKEGVQMSAEKAKSIIWAKIKYKDYWRIATFQHNGGILLCGYNSAMPAAIGAWWCKGNKIFNINGIAANITGNFEFTDDISMDAALKVCGK